MRRFSCDEKIQWISFYCVNTGKVAVFYPEHRAVRMKRVRTKRRRSFIVNPETRAHVSEFF